MQRGKIPVQKSIAQKSYSGPYTFALSDVFESYEIRRYKPLILRAVNKLSVLIQAKTFLIKNKEDYFTAEIALIDHIYNIQHAMRIIEPSFVILTNFTDPTSNPNIEQINNQINEILNENNKKYNEHQRFLNETKLDIFKKLSDKINKNFKDAYDFLYSHIK